MKNERCNDANSARKEATEANNLHHLAKRPPLPPKDRVRQGAAALADAASSGRGTGTSDSSTNYRAKRARTNDALTPRGTGHCV